MSFLLEQQMVYNVSTPTNLQFNDDETLFRFHADNFEATRDFPPSGGLGHIECAPQERWSIQQEVREMGDRRGNLGKKKKKKKKEKETLRKQSV